MKRLGAILENARGKESRVQFARKLGLSYTFVRAMEHGLRFPSDKVLIEIAEKLGKDAEELFLAAYCDRSPHLAEVLVDRGVEIPADPDEGVTDKIDEEGSAEASNPSSSSPAEPAPAPEMVKAHHPF